MLYQPRRHPRPLEHSSSRSSPAITSVTTRRLLRAARFPGIPRAAVLCVWRDFTRRRERERGWESERDWTRARLRVECDLSSLTLSSLLSASLSRTAHRWTEPQPLNFSASPPQRAAGVWRWEEQRALRQGGARVLPCVLCTPLPPPSKRSLLRCGPLLFTPATRAVLCSPLSAAAVRLFPPLQRRRGRGQRRRRGAGLRGCGATDPVSSAAPHSHAVSPPPLVTSALAPSLTLSLR